MTIRQIFSALIAFALFFNNVNSAFAKGKGKRNTEAVQETGCPRGKKNSSTSALRKKVRRNRRRYWRLHTRLNKLVKKFAGEKKGKMTQIVATLGELKLILSRKSRPAKTLRKQKKEWYQDFLPNTTKDYVLYFLLLLCSLLLLLAAYRLHRANLRIRFSDFDGSPDVVRLRQEAFQARTRLEIHMQYQDRAQEADQANSQQCDDAAAPSSDPSTQEEAADATQNCKSQTSTTSPAQTVNVTVTCSPVMGQAQGTNVGDTTLQTSSGSNSPNQSRWIPNLPTTTEKTD